MIAVVVYLGLLPALLFSSGEGIRLVPFPSSPPHSGEKPTKQHETGTRYQENATRIFCDATGQKSPKKQKLPEDDPGALAGFAWCGVTARSTPSLKTIHSAPVCISDREISGISGRAPPLS